MTTIRLKIGDCVEVMKSFREASVGAVVSDPPYGLRFMGKEWDKLTRNLMNPTSEADITRVAIYGDSYAGRRSKLPDLSGFAGKSDEVQEWHAGWLRECYRVLVPGGRILAFGGSRVYHRMAAAFDDVGFVDVGIEAWAYGSGFPKSRNIALTIDKQAGALKQRGRAIPVAGLYQAGGGKNSVQSGEVLTSNAVPPYEPITDDAKTWDGWGTALKPAWEPFVVAKKPLV
jgi:site-specific DNA-methyltransferase (adenine-specific)